MTRAHAKRVLIAKVGLDGHDRALRMLARELRDRGSEVIILGVGTSPERIARSAVQEDVDVVGVSVLSGAHMTLLPLVLDALRKAGAEMPVVCGGTIPTQDVAGLIEHGVAAVASVGTSISEAADLVLNAASEAPAASPSNKEATT